MKENQRKCFKCGRSPASDPTTKLTRFPKPGLKNTLRCELWAKYCVPNEDCSTELLSKLYSEHRMLCEKHFKPEDFSDFSKKLLLRTAVPADVKRVVVQVPYTNDPTPGPSRSVLVDTTNIDPRSTEPQAGPSQAIVSKASTSKECSLYMKCRKNMRKICQLRNRIHRMKTDAMLKNITNDQAVIALSKKITPTFALMLQGEVKNFSRKMKGRRWTKKQKITCLRIYKRSPTCYNLLRRLFCLPTPSTLRKLLSQFPLSVGINKKIFDVLKKFSAGLKPHENEFTLLFDEMSVRKHLQYNRKEDQIDGYQDHGTQGRSPQVASHTLVFMICGVRMKVKQPVAFYLSSSSVTADRLAVLVKEVLYHCYQANINVTSTICDMDGVNRRALGILGATLDDPCIEVHSRKIITMFDPPHLLKCFRNLFMKYDIKCATNIASSDAAGTGIAKWSHIQEFFNKDNLNPNFVFAPVLRQEHLMPNAQQKMRVKLAAQVLSHSVAAGMFCKISQGELSTEATVTADVVSNMDKLFDCLNSHTPDLRRGKPHSTNLTKKTPHLAFFQKMKQFFQSLEFIGCRSKPPSVDGWVWTLNAIQIYWNDLIIRHPTIKSLATRRLQQDALENLFGLIRGHCGSNTNPTTVQFIAALKTTILGSLATAGTKGNNCEGDENNAIFENYKLLLSPEQSSKNIVPIDLLNDFQKNVEDTFEDGISEVNGEIQACAYVCGFIMKNYKNDCASCRETLLAKNQVLEHHFVQNKEYSQTKESLIYCSTDLIKCVEYCAITINNFLEKNSHLNNIKGNIDNVLQNANFNFLICNEHKNDNIIFLTTSTFYICIKRFCTLKNRQFIEEASASALRRKMNILRHK